MPLDFPVEPTPMYFYGVMSFTYVKIEVFANSAAIDVFPVPVYPYSMIEAS
jgi:hypothetical protein